MTLPTGSLFVDPNIQIVGPRLPEQEMKYAWDKTQEAYDKNFADATKLGILAKTLKAREADAPSVQAALDPYIKGLKDIAEKGDYENQGLAVTALSTDFLGNKDLAHLQKNYELEEADKALKRQLQAKGLALDFGADNKVTGFKRDQFQSIQIDPATGERVRVEYTPGVEQRLDWDSRKQNLMANIAREGGSYIKDKLKNVGVSGTDIQFLVQGQYNQLSESTKNTIAKLLLPEYIDSTPEGRQEYRKLTEIDGLSDTQARDVIETSMKNLGQKQVSRVDQQTYTPITPPTSGDGRSNGLASEGQPELVTTEAQASKTYRDASDAYYDAATGNKSAQRAVINMRKEFLDAYPQYKKIDAQLSQTIKSLKLSPKDEFSLRGAINDSNIPYANQPELLSYLGKASPGFAKLSLDQKAKITTLLDSPEIYSMESQLNSFANKGYTGGAYTRTPLVWMGEKGMEAQKNLLAIANQPGVKSTLIREDNPSESLANKEIVGISPYKKAEKGVGALFKVSYKTTDGIETVNAYIKPSEDPNYWAYNPLLKQLSAYTPGYNLAAQDYAAKYGSTTAGVSTLNNVVRDFNPKAPTRPGADKFIVTYSNPGQNQPARVVLQHTGNPGMRLNIATAALHLAAAFPDHLVQAQQYLEKFLKEKTGANSSSDILELNDPEELDEILFTVQNYLR